MKKSVLCSCKNEALFISDVSRGVSIYMCKKPKIVFKGKNLSTPIESTDKPCTFYEEVQVYPHIEPEQKQESPKKKEKLNDPYENLYFKVKLFIDTKLFTLFQEIERECTLLGIPIYNHLSESMYEFCLRVQKLCLSKQTKIL